MQLNAIFLKEWVFGKFFKMQFNEILWISCNSMQFYLKKCYFSYFFHENNDFIKHDSKKSHVIFQFLVQFSL